MDSYNEASNGIALLASDSDESVRFVVESPSSPIKGPDIITRATTHDLPMFSSSGSDTLSSLGKSSLRNIFYLYALCKQHAI